MRTRKASRLLIINPASQVLLFRFVHTDDALAGSAYWATPGGGVEQNESFAHAALRELREETGIIRDVIGESVAERTFEMLLPSGENVLAIEQFYWVKVDGSDISREGWSRHEKAVMHQHRWWNVNELSETTETVYPTDIAKIIENVIQR